MKKKNKKNPNNKNINLKKKLYSKKKKGHFK